MSGVSKLVVVLWCVYTISTPAYSQKQLENVHSANGIKTLAINSDDIFSIVIRTKNTDAITLVTKIEGESFESTLLNTSVVGDTLQIRTGSTPDFIPFNDKLSAHKVLSIALEITLPEGLNMLIVSSLAEVDVKGSIGQFIASLGRGNCHLECSIRPDSYRDRENVRIQTISGDIYIKTPTALVTAQSRNGTVVLPKEMYGTNPVALESIYGNIVVEKSP